MSVMPPESKWPATTGERFSLALLELVAILLGGLVAAQLILHLSFASPAPGRWLSPELRDYLCEVGPGAFAVAVVIPATRGILSGSRSSAIRTFALIHAWLWVLPWLDAFLRRGDGLGHLSNLPWLDRSCYGQSLPALIRLLAVAWTLRACARSLLKRLRAVFSRFLVSDPGLPPGPEFSSPSSVLRRHCLSQLELMCIPVLTIAIGMLVSLDADLVWCESVREVGCEDVLVCKPTAVVRAGFSTLQCRLRVLLLVVSVGLALGRLSTFPCVGRAAIRHRLFLTAVTLVSFKLLELARLPLSTPLLGRMEGLHDCEFARCGSNTIGHALTILGLILFGSLAFGARLAGIYFDLDRRWQGMADS